MPDRRPRVLRVADRLAEVPPIPWSDDERGDGTGGEKPEKRLSMVARVHECDDEHRQGYEREGHPRQRTEGQGDREPWPSPLFLPTAHQRVKEQRDRGQEREL